MERMLRVQTVKFAGPGFSSMSPESKRKARRNGLRKKRVRERFMCASPEVRESRGPRVSRSLSIVGWLQKKGGEG